MLADLLRQEGVTSTEAMGWGDFLASTQTAMVSIAPLSHGLLLRDAGVAIVTERELYGERPRGRRRQRRVRDPEQILSDLTDLHPGSPIVHVDHGVGATGPHDANDRGMPMEFLTWRVRRGRQAPRAVALSTWSPATQGSRPRIAQHRLGSDQW